MSQILSKSEMDALLGAISDSPMDEGTEDCRPGFYKYDLVRQDRIIRGRMPALDIIHDRFVRLFRVTISNILGQMANVSVHSTGPLKFSEFMNSLPLPSAVTLARTENLRGQIAVVTDSKLVFGIMDSLFGGHNVPYTKIEGKDFTDIEIETLAVINKALLQDLEKAWLPLHQAKFIFEQIEINPQFVAIIAPGDIVIATTFEVELEKMSASIKLVIPYASLEPVKQKLSVGFRSEGAMPDRKLAARFVKKLAADAVVVGEEDFPFETLDRTNVGDCLFFKKSLDELFNLVINDARVFKVMPSFAKEGKEKIKILAPGEGEVSYSGGDGKNYPNENYDGLFLGESKIYSSMCQKCKSFVSHKNINQNLVVCTVCSLPNRNVYPHF